MKRIFYILFLLPLFCFGQIDVRYSSTAAVRVQSGASGITFASSSTTQPDFSFTVTTAGTVSAAVYNSDSVMVRTLMSGAYYEAGTYTMRWDGETDVPGVAAPNGAYTVRVLQSNVTYAFQGAVGNTSTYPFGTSTYHHFLGGYFGFAFVPHTNRVFAALGYNEGGRAFTTWFRDYTANYSFPTYDNNHATGIAAQYVCTDGNRVYFGGGDPDNSNANKGFVVAYDTTGGSQMSFSSGHAYTTSLGQAYSSVIDSVTTNGFVTGLDVQRNNRFLAVAHASLNRIHILDKVSGAIVRKDTLTYPTQLAYAGNNFIWAIVNGQVNEYKQENTGALTATGTTLSGLSSPLDVAVPLDSSYVLVVDGGSAQQVKGFALDGTLLWTLGTAGGYATDATVSNNKFMFFDLNGPQAHASFAPDGSFWISERGNYSALHFSSSHTFIERIMNTGNQYSVQVDPNDSSRVFSGFMEFHVNYSGNFDTSWHLVKNWGHSVVGGDYDDVFFKLRCPTTLSNGRTYALVKKQSGPQNWHFVELVAGGQLRFTGDTTSNVAFQLSKTGDLTAVSNTGIGGALSFYRQQLTGFTSNNPVYAGQTTVETVTGLSNSDAWGGGDYANQTTSDGVRISWNPDVKMNAYHLGLVKGGKFIAQTAYGNDTAYVGQYPLEDFENGNGTQHPGGFAQALNRNVFFSAHQEYWKASQTNKYNHYRSDGLFIGQFGVVRPDTRQEADSGMAGNTLSGTFVSGPGGDIYLYHADEGDRGGASRWKISNTSSIVVTSTNITRSGTPSALSDGTDLITSGTTTGWSYTTGASTVLNAGTVSSGLRDKDIRFYSLDAGKKSATRDLGFTSAATDSFVIKGFVQFQDAAPPTGSDSANIDILDNTNKLIGRLRLEAGASDTVRLYFNDQVVLKGLSQPMKILCKYPRWFTITGKGSTVVCRYNWGARITANKSDAAANGLYPKTLRLLLNNSAGGYEIAFNKLNIKKQ